ncbi:hypothetical protein M8C21_022194, partial [Ambrosia artemisiifolia]
TVHQFAEESSHSLLTLATKADCGRANCKIKLRLITVTSWLWLIITVTVAQSPNTTHTDPAEVQAINEMFSQWKIPETLVTRMGWNLSGEPCSGVALEATSFDLPTYNPGIICDCNFPNSTCHITQLKVYAMDVVGPIPEGLWTLKFGPELLDRSLVTFNSTVSLNALSGELPPELGELSDLKLLSFSGNNFTGSLPSEIGNLRNLQHLYIDSSGVGGEIPSTFASLQNMVTVWASDNEFTGRIPDFIG